MSPYFDNANAKLMSDRMNAMIEMTNANFVLSMAFMI
nr:MAG TPA: hypothetical protein [Caudoviricetes sp.]